MLGNAPSQAFLVANAKFVGAKNQALIPEVIASFIVLLVYFVFIYAVIFLGGHEESLLTVKAAGYTKYALLLTFTALLYSWFQGVFSGLLDYRKSFYSGVVVCLSSAIFVLGIFLLKLNNLIYFLNGLVFCYILGLIVYVYFFTKGGHALKLSRVIPALDTYLAVIPVVLPLLLINYIVAPVNWYVNKEIAEISDNQFNLITAYLIAFQWMALISQVANSIGSVFIPLLSKKSNGIDHQKIELLNQFGPWIVVVLMVLPMMLFPSVVLKIYDVEFDLEKFSVIFLLMLLGVLISTYKSGLSRKISISTLSWTSIFSNILWGAMFVYGVNQLKGDGYYGAALAFLFAHLIHFAIAAPFFVWRKMIKRTYMFNWSVLLIYLTCAVASLISLNLNSLLEKILLLVLAMSLVLIMFSGLLKNEKS